MVVGTLGAISKVQGDLSVDVFVSTFGGYCPGLEAFNVTVNCIENCYTVQTEGTRLHDAPGLKGHVTQI